MTPLTPHPGSEWVQAAVVEALSATVAGRDAVAVGGPTVPWDSVLDAIERHRVAPLLAPRAASLGMPASAASALTDLRLGVVRNGLAQLADTRAASDVLARAEVPAVLVKGVSLAALMGQEPAARGAGDVDVLVAPRDLERAERALRDAGWDRRRRVPLEGWRRRVVPVVLNEWVLQRADHVDIDLHWRLQRWYGEFDEPFAALSGRSLPVPAVGPNVRTLAPADALRHLAAHGRKEMWPTLRHLVDVVLLAERCGTAVVAQTARSDRNVAAAVVLAARLAPGSVAAEVAGRQHPTTTRFVDEVFEGCRSLALTDAKRTALTGRSALEMRWRTERWWWRTAPAWTVRAGHLASRLLPWNALAAPGPWWVAYRDAVLRAFGVRRGR